MVLGNMSSQVTLNKCVCKREARHRQHFLIRIPPVRHVIETP